jgi:HEAT repeat protein
MLTWWRNSKKCSTPEALALAAVFALPSLSLAASPPATAPMPELVEAQGSSTASTVLSTVLRNDIRDRRSSTFDALLKRWQGSYGTRAVPPLIKIAADRGTADPDRFIALMGAAKLGGTEMAPILTPFLKDRSWMIRSGALRALAALNDPRTAREVLPLLNDPALVVRSEAVDAVERLRPEGAVDALISTIEHSHNYHAGKAQWVPQKALAALVSLKAVEVAPKLRPLLRHELDPELQKLTVETLEALTGKKLKQGASIAERIKAWDTELKGS